MKGKTALHKIWHIVKPAIIFVLTLGISAIAKKAGPAENEVRQTATEIEREVIDQVDQAFDENEERRNQN